VLAAVSTDGSVKQRVTLQETGDVREPCWGPYLR
jgi:Tol biopolymer transport system component